MNTTLRKLRIIHIALISWLALLIYLAENLHRSSEALKPAVLWALVGCGIYLTMTILVYRVRRLSPALEKVRQQPSDVVALKKWEVWNIVILGLSESLGLYGTCLRFMGSSFAQAAGFYAGGIVLLLLSTPRRP
jgi:hypothetical protein